MQKNRAIKLAIQAVEKRISSLAFEANLKDKLGATHKTAEDASKERRELLEAIEVLERMRHE